MPNFPPLKRYVLRMIDQMIDKYSLRGPFLDAGCGVGDVSAHIARRGWEGLAVDWTPAAVEVARRNLASTGVRTQVSELLDVSGEFRLILLCTVIEHIRDDRALLRHLHTLFPRDGSPGHLIISMPSNPAVEWRWDDDFYGHFRRYTRADVEQMLAASGFRLVCYWDYTFPVFWAMRRAYTALLKAKQPRSNIPEENTFASSLQSAWEMGPASRALAAMPIWPLVFSLQEHYREGDRGYEAIALAERI
jgi:SAM-dependent methyltransferase